MPPYKRAGIRAEWHDYTGAGFYMITLVTAPRRNLFGCCKDNAVQLSSEGNHVVDAWHKMPFFTPQIEAQELCVMPDHLHGILFAKEKLPRTLSTIVRGFKSGITSALRRLSQDPTLSVFQDGFHDLVSLQVKSIKAYSAYIRDNPRRYCLKREHPTYLRDWTIFPPKICRKSAPGGGLEIPSSSTTPSGSQSVFRAPPHRQRSMRRRLFSGKPSSKELS